MLENFSKKNECCFVDSHLHFAECMKNEDAFSLVSSSLSGKYAALTCMHSISEFEEFAKVVGGAKALQSLPLLKKSFGIHPQNPDLSLVPYLEKLLEEKQVSAIGETGLDFFTEEFKATRETQLKAFAIQLELASFYKVPVVVHMRKSYSEIVSFSKELSAVPFVIFHGFPMGLFEATSLLKKNVNAYFSIGKALLRGSAKARECVTSLPLNRLLLETDAPYMTLKDEAFSSVLDIKKVYEAVFSLRSGMDSGIGMRTATHTAPTTQGQRDSFTDFCSAIYKNFESIFPLR